MEGGKEANGASLYIARVKYSGGVHPAKCGGHLPAAHLVFGGTEVLVNVRIKLILRAGRSDSDTLATGLRSVVPRLNGRARC